MMELLSDPQAWAALAALSVALESQGPVRAQSSPADNPIRLNARLLPFGISDVTPDAGGDARYADPARHPLPPRSEKTIGDTLSARGISWAWYSGGWNAALADGMQSSGKHAVIYNRGVSEPWRRLPDPARAA